MKKRTLYVSLFALLLGGCFPFLLGASFYPQINYLIGGIMGIFLCILGDGVTLD
jgi:hypothetical protein